MVGAYELLVAGQAAEDALDQAAADAYRAFEALGLNPEDALEAALASVEEMLSSSWKLTVTSRASADPFVEAVQRQAERTWINGCLVGVLLERPPVSFDRSALRSARRYVRAERPRTRDWVTRLLGERGFAPWPSLHHATVLGASFIEPLNEFDITHEQKRSCLVAFGSLWLDGLLVGCRARLPPLAAAAERQR